MRFLIDENLSGPRLASRLRAQGHDPVLAGNVGLLSVTDARLMIYSITDGLPVLTQDSEDFEDLHDLVMAAVGHHAGILIVRFDNDRRHNLTDRGLRQRSASLSPRAFPFVTGFTC
jgi:predicted nuclease of predicted toxin-antitoxin system